MTCSTNHLDPGLSKVHSIDDFRGEISLMGEIKRPPIFYWANFLY
jgi:hypothetical protein